MTNEGKLKLSLEEKDFLEKVSAISVYDKKIVNDVFISLLHVISLELFDEENIIYIPYIGNISINYYDKIEPGKGVDIQVDLQAEASDCLKNTIKQFSEGETSPTQEYMRLKITENIRERVE